MIIYIGLNVKIRKASVIYAYTIKACGRLITLKNDVIIKYDGKSHNHAPKSSNNVQAVLNGLKCRVLTDNNQSIGKIYDEEVEKFRSFRSFLYVPIDDCFYSFQRREIGTTTTVPVFDAWK